ncbi:hypothetical protein DFP72DRAFT_811817, partial [Ephemerocybe angulata]
REIFAQQPNRLFVRILVMTEEHVRVIQFDRGGALYSPLIPYHDEPDTLMRLIIGLSSVDEAELGLDTTIQWGAYHNGTGRKTPGTISVFNKMSNQWSSYRMRGVDPLFQRNEIIGRTMRMWHVVDSGGQVLVVKDAWIEKKREAEHYYLLKARGVMGVQQLVDYEDRTGLRHGELKFLRPACEDGVGRPFENKVFQRIVTPCYGEALETSTHEHKIFAALHDAIAAHERLLDRGILHCDVSLGNVLFGVPGAPDGLRGILIDLDLAVRVQFHQKPIDPLTSGTLCTQSQFLLRGYSLRFRPAHDYLDDLESFFWTFVHLIYDEVDHEQGWAQGFIDAFDSSKGESGQAKRAFLERRIRISDIPKCWGEECGHVLIAFQQVMRKVVREKEAIVKSMDREWDPAQMRNLHANKRKHYQDVLDIFEMVLY